MHFWNQFRHRTAALAVAAVAGSALIAAGCGGSDSVGGGGDAPVTDSKALELIGSDIAMLFTVNADLDGDGWSNFWDNVVRRVNADAPESPSDWIGEDSGDDADSTNWSEDFEPWVGDTVGVAVSLPGEGSSGGALMWMDATDTDAARESFEKNQDDVTFEESGDYVIGTTPDDDEVVAIGNDLVLSSDSRELLDAALEGADDPISDSDTFTDLMDNLGSDTLLSGFVNGTAVAEAMKASGGADASAALACAGSDASEAYESMEGLSFGIAAGDDAVSGGMYVAYGDDTDVDELAKVGSHDLMDSLPADTVVAASGTGAGEGLSTMLEALNSPECAAVLNGAGAADAAGATSEELMAMDPDELAEMSPEEMAKLAESVAGESGADAGAMEDAMSGAMAGAGVLSGLAGAGAQAAQLVEALGQLEQYTGLQPEQYADLMPEEAVFAVAEGSPVPTFGIAWDNDDKELGTTFTSTLVGAAAAAGGGAASTSEVGDFEVSTAQLAGLGISVVGGVSDDTGVIATSESFVSSLGGDGDTLSDSPGYSDAIDGAGVPGEVAGMLWIDVSGIGDMFADLAALNGSASAEGGPLDAVKAFSHLVAWGETDGDMASYKFELAMSDEE